MAKLLPLVIGLFAKLIGLGGLSKRVMKIFKKIRKRVDKAVNKLLKKAKKAGRKLMRKLGIGKKKKKKRGDADDRTPQEMEADLKKGVQDGTTLIKGGETNKKKIKKKLNKIAKKYDLIDLKLVVDKQDPEKETVHVHGEVNPNKHGEKVDLLSQPLPEEGKVLLVYREDNGAHYQVVLSSGTIFHLELWHEGTPYEEIAIKAFSLIKGGKKGTKKGTAGDIKVLGHEFVTLDVDRKKAADVDLFNEFGGKRQQTGDAADDYKKLKDNYEVRVPDGKKGKKSKYKRDKFDCFSFVMDFVNKVINLKNVKVDPQGEDNPAKWKKLLNKE